MPDDRIQFRPGPLGAALAARADGATRSVSQVAQRDLGRYYYLLALALGAVVLSEGEAALIVDALNGSYIELMTAQLLAADIADSLDDGLADKWDVDGPALVAKVAGWSLASRLAVCDAVERFWRDGCQAETMADRLAAVGLIRRG